MINNSMTGSYPFSFLFTLFIGVVSSLLTLAAVSSSNLFSLVNAEGQQQEQEQPFIRSSLNDGSGYIYYSASAFIKELENFINNIEYTFDLEGSQIFPNNKIKQDINYISEHKSKTIVRRTIERHLGEDKRIKLCITLICGKTGWMQ